MRGKKQSLVFLSKPDVSRFSVKIKAVTFSLLRGSRGGRATLSQLSFVAIVWGWTYMSSSCINTHILLLVEDTWKSHCIRAVHIGYHFRHTRINIADGLLQTISLIFFKPLHTTMLNSLPPNTDTNISMVTLSEEQKEHRHRDVQDRLSAYYEQQYRHLNIRHEISSETEGARDWRVRSLRRRMEEARKLDDGEDEDASFKGYLRWMGALMGGPVVRGFVYGFVSFSCQWVAWYGSRYVVNVLRAPTPIGASSVTIESGATQTPGISLQISVFPKHFFSSRKPRL